MANLYENHFISLLYLNQEQILAILDTAADLKANRHLHSSVLSSKTGVLIFEKPSLRTRITFEAAIYEMGGHPINLSPEMVQLGKRESVKDVARNLEKWVHLIIARTKTHQVLLELADASSIPVINGMTDMLHPCQALSFAMTLREFRGDTKVPIVFVGDGNNVCHSLMVLAAKLGYPFTVACPQGYEPKRWVVEACLELCKQSGGKISISNSLKESVKGASVIYTDVWVSMGLEDQTEVRMRDFATFKVDTELLQYANDDVIVSHCLPAHRNEEISSEVLDGPHSIAFIEAENRLHAQKAVIYFLFERSPKK